MAIFVVKLRVPMSSSAAPAAVAVVAAEADELDEGGAGAVAEADEDEGSPQSKNAWRRVSSGVIRSFGLCGAQFVRQQELVGGWVSLSEQ